MKKVTISILGFALILMTACGTSSDTDEASKDAPKEKSMNEQLCECFEMGQEMSKAMKEAGEDMDKMNEIQEKYKDQESTCKTLGNKMEESMKDATEEEQKAKMDEFSDECPAFKELMSGM